MISLVILPICDSLSKMRSHWKNKNWHKFWSRDEFDLRFFKSHIFEVVSVESKIICFSGMQYCFNMEKQILLYTISAVAVLFEGAYKVLLELI